MKIRWLGRDFEVNKNRINVDNFKNEKTLVGISLNRKQMDSKDWKALFLYLFMPYNWLNQQFIKRKL